METNQTPQAEEQENAPKETAPGADEELSMADLLKAEAQVSEKVHSRGVVTVRVVQVTAELVLVDIGEKKEGAIPLADFQDEKTPVPGDEVQAVLEKKGGEGRYTMLSHRRAREKAAWEMTKKMFEAKERVKGKVTSIPTVSTSLPIFSANPHSPVMSTISTRGVPKQTLMVPKTSSIQSHQVPRTLP